MNEPVKNPFPLNEPVALNELNTDNDVPWIEPVNLPPIEPVTTKLFVILTTTPLSVIVEDVKLLPVYWITGIVPIGNPSSLPYVPPLTGPPIIKDEERPSFCAITQLSSTPS